MLSAGGTARRLLERGSNDSVFIAINGLALTVVLLARCRLQGSNVLRARFSVLTNGRVDSFRVARQNEAARAADAAAWMRSAAVTLSVKCRSQGGARDPSTQNNAGGTPASSLL